MARTLARAVLDRIGTPAYVVPCQVTQLSPLLVTINGAGGIPGVKIAGATYSLGAANALLLSPAQPIILPIG